MNKYKRAFHSYQVDSSMLNSSTNGRYGAAKKDDEALILKAIGKRIPKPLVRFDLDCYDKTTRYACQDCGKEFNKRELNAEYRFCPDCGQKIGSDE